MVPFWGRFAAHFRTYFSGDWDVHWGLTDLSFDPWPYVGGVAGLLWGGISRTAAYTWNADSPGCRVQRNWIPQCPFTLWGEGSPTKTDYRKKGYPYSNLSTKKPRKHATSPNLAGLLQTKCLMAFGFRWPALACERDTSAVDFCGKTNNSLDSP